MLGGGITHEYINFMVIEQCFQLCHCLAWLADIESCGNRFYPFLFQCLSGLLQGFWITGIDNDFGTL